MIKSITLAMVFLVSSVSFGSTNLTPEESVGLNSILRQVSQMETYKDDEALQAFLDGAKSIDGLTIGTALTEYRCGDADPAIGAVVCTVVIETTVPLLKGATLRQAREYKVHTYQGHILEVTSEMGSLS